MSRRTQFVCYQPKTILNKGKRADHWFWTRYSVYRSLGRKGLESIPGISPSLAGEIEVLIDVK